MALSTLGIHPVNLRWRITCACSFPLQITVCLLFLLALHNSEHIHTYLYTHIGIQGPHISAFIVDVFSFIQLRNEADRSSS